MKQSDNIFESTIIYDGSNHEIDCSIKTQNEGKICNVKTDQNYF